MSKAEMLRVVVHERLTAAAAEIFGVFEKTIAQYEEQLYRAMQENERQRKLLDAVLQPEVRVRRAVLSEGVLHNPESTCTKNEEGQLLSSREGEQLPGSVPVKSEEHEERAQPPLPHQRQMETECNGEDCRGLQTARALHTDSFQPVNDDQTPASSEQAHNSHDELSREPQSDLNSEKQTQTDLPLGQLVVDEEPSESSEPEAENTLDCTKTIKPQSDLKTLTNNGVPEGDEECKTPKKSLSCSDTQSPSVEKPFICSVHAGKKVFRCTSCKKQFNTKGDAVRHFRTHTGEKPFSCSLCGKRFTQSTSLGTHMRTHTGEKPYSCSVCSRRFIRSGYLVRHMRVHTGEKPYNCAVCDTRFTLSQSLLKHMRIHTGEKPFSCSVCDKKFTQKGHLTQHMTLHTQQKSFSCTVCGRTFTRQSRVKNHKCTTESNSSSSST